MNLRYAISFGLILFLLSGILSFVGLFKKYSGFMYSRYIFFAFLAIIFLLFLYRIYEKIPARADRELRTKLSYMFVIFVAIVFIGGLWAWIPFLNVFETILKYFFWTAAVIAAISYAVNRYDRKFKHFGSNVFQVSLLLFLGLLLANEFIETKVSLEYMLAMVLVLGVLSIMFPYEARESKWDKIMQWIIAIAGGVIIFYKTDGLGWLRWITAIVSGLLIILMSNLMYEDEKA